MAHIDIRGAREHNLRNLSLRLPRQALIAFTGRSGSGKSSLAFDTLHAEAQRRFIDVLALHSRGLTRGLRRPDVDEITGLPPTIALDQRYRAPSPLTTVGTWSEAHAVLSVLFGRAGVQHCPSCDTEIRPVAHDAIVRALLSLPEGTRLHLEAPLHGDPQAVLDEVQRAGFSRIRVGGQVVRLDEVRADQISGEVRVVVDRLKVSADREDRLHDAVRLTARAGQGAVIAHTPEGEQVFVDRPWCLSCARALPDLSPRLFSLRSPVGQCATCVGSGRVGDGVCESCHGARLREEALAVRFAGVGIDFLLSLNLDELAAWIPSVQADEVSAVVLKGLSRRIEQLRGLGLGAVHLGQGCDRLSTGEFQRLRLARQLGAALSGVLYVVDEPAAGLGPHEIPAVIGVLRALVEQGNTVLVVTHQPQIVAAADQVVDFGPGAGVAGGEILYQGDPAGLLTQDSPSGQWLSGTQQLPASQQPKASGTLQITGLSHPPFAEAQFSLPLGQVVALHGPSGCGKSRLLGAIRAHLADHLALKGEAPPQVKSLRGLGKIARMVEVEASSARMNRSNAATYSGLWGTLRTLFTATTEAQIRGLVPAQFSLNQPGGRCEACKGSGSKRVDLDLLADVFLECPVCLGKRFSGDLLEVRWKGHNAAEILDLPVSKARVLLAGHPKLENALRSLADVGLGYLPLGQPARTLSGGEAHRLRLAKELSRARRGGIEGTVYLLDEPTRGLHPADIAVLMSVFRKLVEKGGTVWLATQDPAVVAAADSAILVA